MRRLIILPLLLALALCGTAEAAEWRQVQHGDSVLCVSDAGDVARCSLDEKTGKLVLGLPIITKDGLCPT